MFDYTSFYSKNKDYTEGVSFYIAILTMAIYNANIGIFSVADLSPATQMKPSLAAETLFPILCLDSLFNHVDATDKQAKSSFYKIRFVATLVYTYMQ